MKKFTNKKFTNKLSGLGTRGKWFFFNEIQDFKLTSDYIDLICPDSRDKNLNSVENLKNIVKKSLVREFTPGIQKSKSFGLLVDATMNNILKKSLGKDVISENESVEF